MNRYLLYLSLSTLACIAPAVRPSYGQTVDVSTLDRKVVCGYQGWFRCEGDGSDNGWHHYATRRRFTPGHANIDLWPDVRELPAADRFATPFRHADGRVAEVFSSIRASTVDMHFRWMREYGIDGVFVQRFATSTRDRRQRDPLNLLLTHCQTSARAYGRGWSLMYDLSGIRPGEMQLAIDDWRELRRQGTIDLDSAEYFHHQGKPLVALWGLGFNDRPPMLDEWRALIDAVAGDNEFGRCAIMLGVPYYWRTLDRDTIGDAGLHELIERANIVSPWSVGRLRTPAEARERVESQLKPDLDWCHNHQLAYMPVAFPGFSWHNLSKGRGIDAPLDQIPRLKGEFLRAQAESAQRAGATMLYVAMFDELDEGTAIFKTSQDVPVGESPFVSEPDLASDHYLKVTGEITRDFHATQ